MKKIKVKIYYNNLCIVETSCGCGSGSSCGSKNCGGCSHDSCSKSSGIQLFSDIEASIKNTDVGSYVEFEFVNTDNSYGVEKDVDELIGNGCSLPIVFIDGIARYSGGLRAALIYQDIKELLEDYYHVMI